jgi:hypothetical protein
MGHVAVTPGPSMFIGDVEPTNVPPYIHRCHITNGHILYSSVLTNICSYIYQPYICRSVHWLTDQFIIYSSVYTDERFPVSCSVWRCAEDCIELSCILQWSLSIYLYPDLEGPYHLGTLVTRSDWFPESELTRFTTHYCLMKLFNLRNKFYLFPI